jgi:hypothetical protein
MQSVVSEIFEALGGSTKIALGTGFPIQTVNDWLSKGKPEIPPWRRAEVLAFARKAKKAKLLSPEALAYLQSQERTVGRVSDRPQDAAA